MELAKKIPKRIHQVNRVVYVFGGLIDDSTLVGPNSITPTLLSTESITQLQAADAIVNKIIAEYKVSL